MINRPTKALRMTSGSMAGTTLFASENLDGSVTVKSRQGVVTKMVIPSRQPSSVTAGAPPLLPCPPPVIIGSITE